MKLLESKIYQFGFKVYDMLLLNLYIFIFCIPIITFIPALRAGIKCYQENNYKFNNFIKHLKQNYFILVILSTILSIFEFILIIQINKFFSINSIYMGILVFILIENSLMILQLINLDIDFNNSIKKILKKLIIYGNYYLLKSMIVVIILAIYLYLMIYIETLTFFIFPFLIIVYNKVINNNKIKTPVK
ncbi:MAG: hypothetical protein PWP46_2087 [Fusobacteriaceae bacterium]|jgi:uncharacterized membrane protein YesL|nr:hypothetical protein [Fusobacteriales bacterium]MDN5305200.1 hypothetical protein [Fusobacteriaceae bacterium]